MDTTEQSYSASQAVPSGASTQPGVGTGMALFLVLLAMGCGLLGGLIVGGAGGYLAGRSAAQGENALDTLRRAIGRDGRGPSAPGLLPRAATQPPSRDDDGSEGGGQQPATAEPQGSSGQQAAPQATKAREPYLGVLVQTIPSSEEADATPPSATSPTGGALVLFVEPGSPAQQAGLEPGDRIVAVDGQPIASADELKEAIVAAGIGGQLELRVVRGQESRDVPVVIGSRESGASLRGLPDLRVLPFDPADPDLGELLELLPPELRQQLEDALRSGQWPPTPQPVPGAGDA